MINFTLGFIVGCLVGGLVGGFLIACLNVADATDEQTEDKIKLFRILKLIDNIGMYDFELIRKIKNIIVGDENGNN